VAYVWRVTEAFGAFKSCPPAGLLADALATAETAPVSIDLVADRAGLDALEPEWNELFRRSARDHQLFQSFNWNWHWANHYLPHNGRRCRLAIVTVRRNGRLAVLWPLVAERVAGLSVLHWMGEPASQYGDVLAEDAADTPELLRRSWRFIATRLEADAVFLRKVRADAAVAPLLAGSGMLQTTAAEAPYLDLASAPDSAGYEQRYSAKARKNRRRLLRRLAERGPIEIERLVGPAAREAALDAIALKQTWIAHTGRVAPALADPRFAAFFADAVEGRGRDTGCGVTVLKSNGEIAGIAVDVTAGTRRAAHIIVHDPRLDSFSAGTLLLQEWIRGASADRIATFDLLAPAYAYKREWADGVVAVGDFAAGFTLAGRAWVRVYLGLLRQRIKVGVEASTALIRRLRAWSVGWVRP